MEAPILKSLCDLRGDVLNALIRNVAKEAKENMNDIAVTFGYFMGIYEDGKIPRKIYCIDFVDALGLEEGYDEKYVYGKINPEASKLWEDVFMPKLYDLLGGSFQGIHRFIGLIGNPMEILTILLRARFIDYKLERVGIIGINEEKILEISLCYKDEILAEKAIDKGFPGGFFAGIFAESLAKLLGFSVAKAEEAIKKDNCAVFRYRLLEK